MGPALGIEMGSAIGVAGTEKETRIRMGGVGAGVLSDWSSSFLAPRSSSARSSSSWAKDG
eukprot:4222812-Pyramimonas_sp.AAC.1